MEEERIAERLYNKIPPWERENGTVKDVIEQMRKNPYDIIEYLLDMIDDLV